MIDLQDLLGEVEQCLASAQGVLTDLAGPSCIDASARAELNWISRQVASAQTYLQALLADLNAGMSAVELGFEGEQDLLETVLDLARQVAMLQGRHRAITQGLHR